MSRYEIFQKHTTQQPSWVETANSLAEAKERLKELATMFPADYFIFDRKTACLVIPCDRGSLETEVKPR
jgi:hypothetical protein